MRQQQRLHSLAEWGAEVQILLAVSEEKEAEERARDDEAPASPYGTENHGHYTNDPRG